MHAILLINKNSEDIKSEIKNSEYSTSDFKSPTENLGAIIRGFKGAVTRQSKSANGGVIWQSNYHDHIIRNAEAFNLISNYIINNPENWKEDKFFI